MKAKFPLISYVVTTKFLTNSVGLHYLHKEVFTDEDPRISKRKAIDYFQAAIESLTDMTEVSLRKPDSYSEEKIVYKNPELYNGGVAIFLRLNYDFKFKNITYKEGKEFLMDVFAEYERQKLVKKFLTKKIEQETWNVMGSKTDKQLAKLYMLYRSKLGITRAERRNELAQRIVLNDTATMQIIRNISEIGLISESICAFLNTDGGEIVVGIDEHLSPTGFLDNENFETFSNVLTSTIYTMFQRFERLIEFDVQQINGTNFYYFRISRSATVAFLVEKDGMEFYYRTLAGNVLDFDRAE